MSIFNWIGRKTVIPGSTISDRQTTPQGPYSGIFSDWIARGVSPRFYEALRESVTTIDAAINRLCTMDGIVKIEAVNDRLQRQADEFTEGVTVNDLETGLQQFYKAISNEMYEQGCAIGEMVLTPNGRDVERLKVADSKGIYFRRNPETKKLETWYTPPAPANNTRFDGSEHIERILRNTWSGTTGLVDTLRQNGYRLLVVDNLIYAGYNNEADNPYGVSLMRSMEFVAKTLLTIENSLQQSWLRFGDPSFNMVFKRGTNFTSDAEAKNFRTNLAANLASVINTKRKGNSADFVNVIGPKDDLKIEIIGGDGQVMEVEMPARHVLEQIVSKSGLPSWMLGYHWSTAERLAQRQGEIILQESKTRFVTRKPGLAKIVAMGLRVRGATWKAGDWQVVQELPNLQDIEAQARAEFYLAQADLMRSGAGNPADTTSGGGKGLIKIADDGGVYLPGDIGYEEVEAVALVDMAGKNFLQSLAEKIQTIKKKAPDHIDHKAHGHKSESYVEDAPALTALERRAERALLGGWRQLERDTLKALGLSQDRKSDAPVFVFDPNIMLADLVALQDELVRTLGGDGAELAAAMYEAWQRGNVNAQNELNVADAVASQRADVRLQLGQRGLELVRSTTARAFRDDIVAALQGGEYDGENPRQVAQRLRARFGAHDYDWERLARSEIADAQAGGKLDYYAAEGITLYNFKRAGGACPICVGLAEGGPYPVGSGPRPVRDTHPNCRCTTTAVVV